MFVRCSLLAAVLPLVSCVTTAHPPSGNGRTVALDAVIYDDGFRLAVTVYASKSNGNPLDPQRLLLDTGSSTLAFCDSDYIDELQDLALSSYSCNEYGDGNTGYWGPFFNGDLAIRTNSMGRTFRIAQSTYSVMEKQVGMPCGGGLDGIFGIAFKQLDLSTSQKPDWPESNCPQASQEHVQPLMQFLNDNGGVEQLGVYWSGKLGANEGMLYLDGAATNNPHYDAEQAADIGKALLGETGWYDIQVLSVEYNGKSVTNIECNPMAGLPCIMDTGTPQLLLPQEIIDAMEQGDDGSVSVNLAPKHGSQPVELQFDARFLLANNWVAPSSQIILGLPLRYFYYAVMDISDSSISFTRIPGSEHNNVTTTHSTTSASVMV